ncbi:MAG: TolC family protein [Gammaproteobacteria bacterium]|nr:TolC family protein [Gammaproteobacteria bacterium]MYG67015.1 TolC family protein [Gammaproteobacteria bacterium]
MRPGEPEGISRFLPGIHPWSFPRAIMMAMEARHATHAVVCMVCMALSWFQLPAGAQEGAGPGRLALTLEGAIRLALTGSRAAIEARLEREEEGFALEGAKERYDPEYSLDAGAIASDDGDGSADVSAGLSLRVPSGGLFRLRFSQPVLSDGDQSPGVDLTFSQPLLKGFGPQIDTAPLYRARLEERIHIRAFRDRASDIVGSVISAYRNSLSARRRVAIARDALDRARRQLGINRALVEAGRMAPQDLIQAEAEVADREYSLTDSENVLETADSDLVNLLDLEEGVVIDPGEELPVVPVEPDFGESLETAFARRTDWLRAETRVLLSRLDLRIAENDLLPDLSLSATASHRDGGTELIGRLNLAMPLGDREPKRALARAQNDVLRAEMDLAERRQSIRLQVRRAVQNVAVALRQIELADRARELSERKLEVERRKLQLGLSSVFQVSRFEDDLVSAQNRELDAVVGYRNALTGLDRTLGTTLERWGIGVDRVGR